MSGVVRELAEAVPGYLAWLAPLVVIGILVQFFWQSVVSYQLHKLAKQDRTVEGLEKRLHETTEKLIDERLRAVTHSVSNHANTLSLSLEEMRRRVDQTVERIDGLGEKDHGHDLALLKSINELKQYVIERAASKDDVKEHQREMGRVVQTINGHLGEQDARLIRIEQRCDDRPQPRRT